MPPTPLAPDAAQMYRVLAESAPDAIITIDEQSMMLSVNPAAERIFGYAAAEMLGRPLSMLMPERMRAGHHRGVDRYLTTGRRHIAWQGVRLSILTKSGSEVPVEIAFGEFVSDGRRLFSGFVRDISDRVAAERALEQARAEAVDRAREAERLAEQLQQQAVELELQTEAAHLLAEELTEANARLQETAGEAEDARDAAQAAEARARAGEARLAVLAQASAALAESLDVEATLAAIVRLVTAATAELADGCLLALVGDDGAIVPLPAASRDPAKATLVDEMERRYPLAADAPFGYPAAIRTGEAQVTDAAAFAETVLPAIAHDAEHLRLLRALDMYSSMVVPLTARGRTFGAITLVRHGPERRAPFGTADLALARDLARRAAVALDNARLFSEAGRARREAEAADRTKSEFLATMSHELRTPLNAIGGYAELLELGLRGPVTAAQRQDLERIRRSQQHLLGIITDILDYARIDAGRVAYAQERVPVLDVVHDAWAMVEPQARAREIRYDGPTCDATLTARADPHRVAQIVANLLSNAVKFTAAGGGVRVTCARREGETAADAAVVVRVNDTGVGIPLTELESIFEPFIQLGRGLTRRHEGTGLGLAISRDLARGMGGDLTVESTEGVGSTFTLTLPAA